MKPFLYKIVNHRYFTYFIGIQLVLGVLINLFPLDIPLFKKSSDLANQIMILYLIFGIYFLILNNKNLMLASFIGGAIIALSLKERTDARIKYAALNKMPKVSIALVNLASIDSEPIKVLTQIKKYDTDIIIFQELTPEWKNLLTKELKNKYSNSMLYPRIDIYGLGIFSNIPIIRIDTINYEEVPILNIHCLNKGKNMTLITAYITPPLNQSMSHKSDEELKQITKIINVENEPTIVCGVFNMVSWSRQIQKFKLNNKLQDTRSGFLPSGDKITGGLLSKPVNHIFYSSEFECTDFRISMADNDEYGVWSSFQFKSILEKENN